MNNDPFSLWGGGTFNPLDTHNNESADLFRSLLGPQTKAFTPKNDYDQSFTAAVAPAPVTESQPPASQMTMAQKGEMHAAPTPAAVLALLPPASPTPATPATPPGAFQDMAGMISTGLKTGINTLSTPTGSPLPDQSAPFGRHIEAVPQPSGFGIKGTLPAPTPMAGDPS